MNELICFDIAPIKHLTEEPDSLFNGAQSTMKSICCRPGGNPGDQSRALINVAKYYF
jgi:hypothetical protein